jgi:hypothetical protein
VINKSAIHEIAESILLPGATKSKYGLFYSDENGTIPPFDELAEAFSLPQLKKH